MSKNRFIRDFFKRRLISEKARKNHMRKRFFETFHFHMDFENPKILSEKMQWLKLYYKDPLMTKCTDKYRMREHVKQVVGEKYLNDLIGVYKNVEKIEFESFPNQFVLKINNKSGGNVICKDKTQLDIPETKRKLKEWMRRQSNHYYKQYEWSYKHVRSKIICERYIESSNGLKNYDFYYVNGKLESIAVVTERGHKKNTLADKYDRDWNKLDLPYLKPKSHQQEIPKPRHLQSMLQLSEKLAQPFPYVRVDFFEDGDRVLVNELTFYPGSGFGSPKNIERERQIGATFQLPLKPGFFKKLRIETSGYWRMLLEY